MEPARLAIPAIVVGLAVVSTAMLVSTLVVFRSTPTIPAANCLEPRNGSSREVTLFPQGATISVVSGGFLNSSLPLYFCLNQSVDWVGAWTSTQPVEPFALYAWELPTFLGCDPTVCFHRNGTLDGILFPGSYAMGFLVDTSANVSVNVTESIELVFDRVTEMLQPAGPLYLPPDNFDQWRLTVPYGATNAGFGASEAQVSFGFCAGLMNATEFAEFQQNPSSRAFQGLSWAEESNSGVSGSVLSSPSTLLLTPGNYTLVIWNSSSGNGVLQFDDPLYLAFNAS